MAQFAFILVQDPVSLIERLGDPAGRDEARAALERMVWETPAAIPRVRAALEAASNPEVRRCLAEVLSSTRRIPEFPFPPRFLAYDPRAAGRLVVWGGAGAERFYMDGAVFDPDRMVWTPIPACPLAPREFYETAWIGGGDLLVWGGVGKRDGAVYRVNEGKWIKLPDAPLEGEAREILGGDRAIYLGSRAVFFDGAWQELPGGFPRDPALLAMTGENRLLAWSAEGGAVYDPASRRASAIPAHPRRSASFAWVGDRLFLASGAMFDPSTARWEELPAPPVDARPPVRIDWTAEWILLTAGAEGALLDRSSKGWTRLPKLPEGGRVVPGMVAVLAAEGLRLFEGGEWKAFDYPAGMGPRRAAEPQKLGELVVAWGGLRDVGEGRSTERWPDGAAFDVAARRWLPIRTGGLSPREGPAILRSGARLIVWGGAKVDPESWFGASTPLRDGAAQLWAR